MPGMCRKGDRWDNSPTERFFFEVASRTIYPITDFPPEKWLDLKRWNTLRFTMRIGSIPPSGTSAQWSLNSSISNKLPEKNVRFYLTTTVLIHVS